MNNLYNVMTKTKGKLVNFRVREDVKRDFEIAAELRGTTLSGLIHQLMIKTVREEKDREPKAFEAEITVETPNITQEPHFEPEIKDEGFLDDEHAVKTKKRKVK